MEQTTTSETVLKMDSSGQEARDVLREILWQGAQQMLAAAIENEVADRALDSWAAARKAWPTSREQRCWVHKTANVLKNLTRLRRGL